MTPPKMPQDRVQLRNGLADLVNRYDDGEKVIMVPRRRVSAKRTSKFLQDATLQIPPAALVYDGAMIVFDSNGGTFQSIAEGVSGTTIVFSVGTPPPAFSFRIAIFITTTECTKGAITYSWTKDGVDMGVSAGYIQVTVSNGALGSDTYVCTLTFPDATTATFEVTIDVQV